jgi:hypothetical protein
MNSKALQIGLTAAVIGLSVWLVMIIMRPIKFDEKYNARREVVIERMMQIRTAQGAYKEGFGSFAKDFESLVAFADTGHLTIIQRRDSTFKRMNTVYMIEENVDTLIIDTLGSFSVRDSLFTGVDMTKWNEIPFSKGEKFEMDAGILIKSGGLKVPVFEVIAPAKAYCRGLDKLLIQERAEDLRMGSMTEATLSGNWQ